MAYDYDQLARDLGIPHERSIFTLCERMNELFPGPPIELVEVPAPPLMRDYECANAKMSQNLGFIPRRSVLEAVNDLLARIDPNDRTGLTDPRKYNIRWLERLTEIKPQRESFSAVLGEPG